MVKTKLKPILPSLRKKKRYIAFEVISDNKIQDFEQVSKEILRCAGYCLGLFEMAKAGIIPLANKWDTKSQRGMLKVNNMHVDAIKASFVFTQNMIIKSRGVSGILKKAENKFIKN